MIDFIDYLLMYGERYVYCCKGCGKQMKFTTWVENGREYCKKCKKAIEKERRQRSKG